MILNKIAPEEVRIRKSRVDVSGNFVKENGELNLYGTIHKVYYHSK